MCNRTFLIKSSFHLLFLFYAARSGARHSWWWLRTGGASSYAWRIYWRTEGAGGQMFGYTPVPTLSPNGGVRPALIINQAN